MAEIDIVVVAYNAADELEVLLTSIAEVDVPFSFALIDNASPDPRVGELVSAFLPRINDLELCEYACDVRGAMNLGYARACNAASLAGNAPYIGFLNADVVVLPGSIGAIVAYMDAHPDVGICGPRTTDSLGRFTHAGIVAAGGDERHRYWLHHDTGQASDIFDAPTVSGATYFVRRSVWEELANCPHFQRVNPGAQGAFLETQHYFEERYVSFHAQEHGHRVVYLGAVKMIHEWHRSSEIGSPLSDGLWEESRSLYERAVAAHREAVRL